jgi:hypothetical protein
MIMDREYSFYFNFFIFNEKDENDNISILDIGKD